jgi:acyl carrier protein
MQRVMALVARHLPDPAHAPTDPDADLKAAGLDSIRTVALLVDVEGEFGLQFPPERITPVTFGSVRNLYHAVLASTPGGRG